jgi:putative protease
VNHKPQILAPAGGQAQIDAAIHAGADAVYFGLQSSFNARARAIGIPPSELETVMQQLHRHGVEGYLALNTLVFDEELEEVEKHIRLAARCGVDALIVQDIGVIQLARHIAPHLPLHGSTQMSITDAEGVAFAESLGIERIVVGRELSIDEISQIEAKTSIEIEAFVHGALCVSYSGQCFSSEAWGGRSANRGQCAQACRLPYGLLVDGKIQQQGDMNYLLSPQDLMALGQVPQLIEAGVSCFKIEGRLKGPEYVLSTISAYREAVDRAWDAHLSQNPLKDTEPSQEQRRRLAQVFSRGQGKHADGLTPGFLHGPHHQELVIGRNPRHRGLYLGTVSKITDQGVELTLNNPVKAGDGVVFDSGNPQAKEAGGNVFTLLRKGKVITEEVDSGEVTLTFAKHVRLDHVQTGDIVWRTKDTRMDSGPNLSRETRLGGLSTDIHISLVIGKPITIELSSHRHHLKYESETFVEAAQKRALDEASVTKAIGTLGDTSLELNQLTIALDDNCFVPVSQLKQARREAVEAFSQQIITHQRDKDLSQHSVLNNLLLTADPVKQITPDSLYFAEPKLKLMLP